MSDTHMTVAGGSEQPKPNMLSSTEEFDAALVDAGRLLEYAASSGLLPEQPPTAAVTLIGDVVLAQAAARSGTLTPQMVIVFWVAYGRLAHLVEPVTAASLAACKQFSLIGMKVRTTLLVVAVILISIFLFMSTTTLSDTSDLIDQQNAAALKLWSDIQMLRTSLKQVSPTERAVAPIRRQCSSPSVCSRRPWNSLARIPGCCNPPAG